MDTLQSVMQSLSICTDEEEENGISSRNAYELNSHAKSEYILNTSSSRQWQKRNCPTRSHQNTFSLYPPLETGDEEEIAISHQWQRGNRSTGSDRMKYVASSTVVSDLRSSSSSLFNMSSCSSLFDISSSSLFNISSSSLFDISSSSLFNISSSSLFNMSSSSSLFNKSVNDNKVKSPDSSVKENVRWPREEIPARMAAEDRWIKHYSSRHWILLVGEGDFSFSASLAKAFGSASNMVATSLDSQEFLMKNYGSALSNLVELGTRKCIVMHNINATEMANHPLLGGIKFDRIIFNFPFAGFFKELPREAQLRLHRRLVSGFLENAQRMLRENGEIHITHKTNGFHKEWKLEALASLHKLRVEEVVEFNNLEYEGYNSKYGFGGDNNFNCNPSMTYKLRL